MRVRDRYEFTDCITSVNRTVEYDKLGKLFQLNFATFDNA